MPILFIGTGDKNEAVQFGLEQALEEIELAQYIIQQGARGVGKGGGDVGLGGQVKDQLWLGLLQDTGYSLLLPQVGLIAGNGGGDSQPEAGLQVDTYDLQVLAQEVLGQVPADEAVNASD